MEGTRFGLCRIASSLEETRLNALRHGAHLWACRMSVDIMHLDKDDLFDDVEDVINVSEFIELSDGAQVIFV
jgi:peroxiredoxin family protein